MAKRRTSHRQTSHWVGQLPISCSIQGPQKPGDGKSLSVLKEGTLLLGHESAQNRDGLLCRGSALSRCPFLHWGERISLFSFSFPSPALMNYLFVIKFN